MDYPRRSANPVGRLVLHLFGRTDAPGLAQSAAICSSLQFINFWQDDALDRDKGRIYTPQEDLQPFGVLEETVAAGRPDAGARALSAFKSKHSPPLLSSLAPLSH